MKIASFAFRSHPAKGGVEYHQKMISEYFAKKDNDVTVYTSRNDSNTEFFNIDFKFPFLHLPKNKSRLKYSEDIDSVHYKRFDIKIRCYSYNRMNGLYKTFKKDILEYDIVHLHGLNVYNTYRLAKISYKNNVPVILSCYDISIPDNLPSLTKILKNIYDRVYIKKLNKYVSKFLLLTQDQVKELKDLGIDSKKIQVWSAGYDISRYRKHINTGKVKKTLDKYSIKSKQYAFNMGRIEEYKGIQDIITIAKDFPKMKFIIAGKDQGYLDTLQKLIKDNNIDNVQFIGEIDEDAATILLQNAYIFIFPSKKEGWGIVLAEAMSVGVPCIAYNIQNVRTVFTDKKSGFYVNTVKEMEHTLTMIINNKRLHDNMSKYAFKEAEKYDYHNTLPELEKIYNINANHVAKKSQK